MRLCRLVAAAKQDNDTLSALHEIHPTTGAVINPQFRDAFAHRLGIAKITRFNSSEPNVDARSGNPIFQPG